MNGLLVRVGADLSDSGGSWNGLVDSHTGEFRYVPIPDDGPFRPGLATPYALTAIHFTGKWPPLPSHLAAAHMHLDPDYQWLTYGDVRQRAIQILRLGPGDLLVFYAGLRDIWPSERLVYAIIGLYVIDSIVPALSVLKARWHENAHTRRKLGNCVPEIVVLAKPKMSGRLESALPIGEYRDRAYRVKKPLLSVWGGLSVRDGYLQRSARLPKLLDAPRFYRWFLAQEIGLVQRNN